MERLPSNKEGKILNALLSVAYRLSFPKSRPQLYRSYTEFATLPRPRGVLALTCLGSARCARPDRRSPTIVDFVAHRFLSVGWNLHEELNRPAIELFEGIRILPR
jgi:hypothetical protein